MNKMENNNSMNLNVNQSDIIDMLVEERVSVLREERTKLLDQRNAIEMPNTDSVFESLVDEVIKKNKNDIKKVQSVFKNLVPVPIITYKRNGGRDMMYEDMGGCGVVQRINHREELDGITCEKIHMVEKKDVNDFKKAISGKGRRNDGRVRMMHPAMVDTFFLMHNFFDLMGKYPNSKVILASKDISFDENPAMSKIFDEIEEKQKQRDEFDKKIRDIGNQIHNMQHDRNRFKAGLTRSILEGSEEGKQLLERVTDLSTKLMLEETNSSKESSSDQWDHGRY